MLVIRNSQLRVFSGELLKGLSSRAYGHVRECFPAACDKAGPQAIQELIDYSLRRAAAYGFETEQDLCRYVDLAMTFGRDFDRDPALPWARRILVGRNRDEYRSRMDQLFGAALEVLE